jgi:putative endonuclease
MKRGLHPCIYIMTNKGHKVLYTGITSNLFTRVAEHKDKMVAGFTSSYNVTKSVYYEEYNTMEEAIAGEKQIKGGSRQKKIDLINSKNPEWKDLYEEFFA